MDVVFSSWHLTLSCVIAVVRKKKGVTVTLQLKAMFVMIWVWQRRELLILNQCHLILLVKVCHMHLKGGLILVMYGAGKYWKGPPMLDIFVIDTFIFQSLFRYLLTRDRASEPSVMLSDTLNQIFLTWELKHSLVYLAGRSPLPRKLPEKVSLKLQFCNFLFNLVFLFSHPFLSSFFVFNYLHFGIVLICGSL